MRKQIYDGLLIYKDINLQSSGSKENWIYSTFKATKGEVILCPNSGTSFHFLLRSQSEADELANRDWSCFDRIPRLAG
jgi:hypothetical protein